MKFDLVLTNPPFHDAVHRKKTPHKLWIDFTLDVFDRLLADGGSLVQVSPASFASPSNVVLDLMGAWQTNVLRVGTGRHFPQVSSTFADYWIVKTPHAGCPTTVVTGTERFEIDLDRQVTYLPNDLSRLALSIHEKVMYAHGPRLEVEWDYVTAHNVRRYDDDPSLVEERDDLHPYPVFHTNRATWWSSVRQEWADCPKVMWTRSGYTRPFFDPGVLGGTDMVYFVRVASETEGRALAHNLRSEVLRYVLRTARWSGFGNERVFRSLPDLPRDRRLSDPEMHELFGLTAEEVDHVARALAPARRQAG